MTAIDLFAGGGGASHGIRSATGRSPILAVNHDDAAIRMHAANHPETAHETQDIAAVDPARYARRRVDLLWASPDCTHFSRAKGAQPREQGIRGLAWNILPWVRATRPRVVFLENVPEFQTWGPLDGEGRPIPERAGADFDAFVGALRLLGYRVAWRVLCAADYGAPTIRRRLYLIARRDADPVWPEPSHGPGRAQPWRTAAEVIDWTIPCPSIFGRKRPLADATLRRIAAGVHRYVLQAARPFVLCITHGGRVESLDAPLNTTTAAPRGERALIAPALIRIGNGEAPGQRPRTENIAAPLSTVVGSGKHAIVAAFLAKHYTGVVGQPLDRPIGTVTAVDHHAAVGVHLVKLYGSAGAGAPVDAPLPTVTGGGQHIGLVAAFLTAYYSGGGTAAPLDRPTPTATATARLGLVTVRVDGADYVLADIGMRMLEPRELARAQGFPDDYVLTGNKTQQIARIGNSVCPPVAEAIVRANLRVSAPARP